MPRRSKAKPENHERWLVSYADFVTLLFAFFVVMFATSHVDAQRMQQISEAYSAIMSKDAEQLRAVMVTFAAQKQAAAASQAAKDPDARRVLTMAEMEPVRKRVEQRLAPLIEGDKIGLALTPRGLIISLRESGFFPPGQATFLPGAAGLLSEVGAVVADLPNQPVRMEGHTDNTPIRTARFPSNWELSTARAINVGKFLVEDGIPPERIAVAGFASFQPLDDRFDEIAYRRNRRIEIKLTTR
jgi:chemotaxis protein MotB